MNYLLSAVKAAIEAGGRILDIYNNVTADFQVEYKNDRSPLTLADKEAHRLITDRLNETQLPVLSEEGKEIPHKERARWKRFWLVDPVDGTKEFINRNGEFTVNIALIEKGQPVIGVVLAPVSGELYFASAMGSYKSDIKNSFDPVNLFDNALRLPVFTEKERYVVAGSRSHMSFETEEFIRNLDTGEKDIEIISKGSSLKICMVAEGNADIYPRLAPTMEWDTAAAHAIAKFAGREVIAWPSGEPLVYNKDNLVNPWFVVK